MKMKKFFLASTKLNLWLHQNKAEILDSYEGVLLDYLLVKTKRGYAGIYESYETPNSSKYYIEFSKNDEAVDQWCDFFHLTD